MKLQTTLQLVLTLTLLASSAPVFAGEACNSKQCDKAKISGKSFESKLPKISRSQIQSKLDKVTLVDALDAKYYDRSRIKGSVNVPMDSIETTAAKALPDKNAELVVYCMNTKCHASDKVADGLSKLGYKHVSIYREGLQDWISAGLPAEGTNPTEPIAKQKTAAK
jgi:rhodanese-related sulfurtransferase